MKRIISALACFLVIFAITSVSLAGSGARMRQAMEAMGAREIAGEVTAVEDKGRLITVKGMRSTVTATCDETTFVKMANVIKTCADIKVGDRANLLFESSEGMNKAKSIFLSVPTASPAGEKKAEPPAPEPKKE